MQKTLKDLFEVYRPKSPDEQKFVDKHVTIKHKDRNGNADDVFNASNVKTIKRKEDNHGYDSGDDEKVYEEVEFVDEAAEDAHFEKQSPKMQTAINHHLRKGKSYQEAVAAAQKHVKEEVEDLDESAKVADHLIKRYGTNVRKSHVRSAANDFGVGFVALSHAVRKKLGVNRLEEDVEEIEEKKLTPAEMKKREEVAKAIERENPKMPMAKKMAIATATAKKVAEEAESIDELSRETVGRYSMKAKSIADNEGGKDRTKGRELAGRKRWGGTMSGVEKAKVMATEESDQIDELSRTTLGSYAKKAMKDAPEKDRMGKAFSDLAGDEARRGDREGASHFGKKAATAYTKAANRRAGMEKAIDKMAKEEVEQVNEISTKLALDYTDKASDARGHRNLSTQKLDKRYKSMALAHEKIRARRAKVATTEEVEELGEDIGAQINELIRKKNATASPIARKNIESQIAKLKRQKSKMSEEVEGLEELSKTTLASYVKKAAGSAAYNAMEHGKKKAEQDEVDRMTNRHMSFGDKDKIHQAMKTTHRDVEKPREKAGKRIAGINKAIGKLTKEQVIDNAIEKFMPELEDYKPMTQEEKLVAKLDGLSESHALTLLSLFESLNEDNRTKMLMIVDTREGVNSLLDFALQNRGE